MLKKVGRILLGVLLILVMVASCIYVIISNNQKKSLTCGTITVIVNDINDNQVDARRIEYNKDDTLFSVINDKYSLIYEEGAFGHYLTGISNDVFKIETNGKSSWLWFELAYLKEDKTYSDSIDFVDYEIQDVLTGIDGIELKDNMIFAINERDMTHESSVFNDNISFNKKETNDLPFRIILYSLAIIFVIGIIVFIIINRKGRNPITVKELCILSFMSVLLFVQEEVLSFIPNFQLTFILLAVYVSVFGYKKTSLIIFAHVLLDNIFMGSLTPIVVIPMWMGYMIYTLIIWVLRNRSIWLITLGGIVGALIYCMLFLVTNAIFLDINVYLYWISDIPFEVMLVTCTSFTLIYLYKPLTKKLNELYMNNDIKIDSIDEDDKQNGEIL